jgi:pimeloyl-ACP methyl ester carboxylesterase
LAALVTSDAPLAHDRSGPTGKTPILLIHAGIADRGMWDPQWQTLSATRDVVRVDLRGYGESTERPEGSWSPRADVLEVLSHLGIGRAHLVGCSFGAGVAVELALQQPALVASLVLAAPGGALLTERTDELMSFFEAEGKAIEAGDLDAAAEANVVAWVDGPHRGPEAVPAAVRDAVRAMQRRAFDLTIGWPDEVWEAEDELDPEAPERLAEIGVPTLVVSGALDIDSVRMAADMVAARVPGARLVEWPDVAHLPSMERPDEFAALVLDWVGAAAD